MIGVYITSYQKPNKESINLLKRSIGSVLNQTNKDFKLYVVLDNYTDNDQIEEIKSLLPADTYLFNTDESYSDKNYPRENYKRWCTGGLNPTVHAIDKMLADGIEWICRLDHDDWWTDDHLDTCSSLISDLSDSYVFITTRGKLNNLVFPPSNVVNENYYPMINEMFHSTTCINFKKIPLRYEDPFKNGYSGPGDAWMWIRLSKYMVENNLKGFYIPKLTLIREREGDVRNGR